MFARQGIPTTVVSENARQYDYQQFLSFAKTWEFQQVIISPTQSNGQVKNCVKTVKTLLKKATRSVRDPRLALVEYQNTSLDGTNNYAPTQMLNSRLLKSRLHTAVTLLKPHVVPLRRKLLRARQENKTGITRGKLDTKFYPE